ncbi:Transposon TX1 uncharacterized 149 kDa protein [Vitis vinifera]|uniref:Transposon TX1 uncharacterized 149 kDa protein n=1 Tax=Vitis vinifera TaxID=29760 RepID=A0A438DCW1_VITVI|nr:Transposon TX1 uncharacterized 149 kDa protein [Vitis vinifera]
MWTKLGLMVFGIRGEWISEGIVNAFRSLLSNPGDWRPPLSGLQCETLQNLDVDALEAQFTGEEVHGALLGCNGDKAPGPDGFTMAFWQPISLVGSLYKWLAKVLANRLKKVVGKVVSKAQGAFVEGRQILDVVLIANEVIDSILKNNKNGFMCKLDIEKAYNNVDWSFLLTVMQKMGFGEKWIGWIKWCISTASFSVLINGTSKAISGLRIKLEKSELILVGRVENIDDLALDFGCRVGSLPSTYLGLPLGAPFKTVSVWDGVEERFRKRLAM